MKLSQIIFRISFALLAIIYIAVITEFLNPDYFKFNIEIGYDVLALTAAVGIYVFFFFKRNKHF
ncbi:hypothetical protein [Glaciecola petra]|uniref:Uncharacterized protein n=1 Tax=Glaciecola petra TaxID=3075602 RepID=A0ABU2ZNT2_9ALTE|nr:hypothetical protein [Aestuariibacter sp. P117]MDT0593239.1 hypothetical protein [Aestuariibacter sp. P117]